MLFCWLKLSASSLSSVRTLLCCWDKPPSCQVVCQYRHLHTAEALLAHFERIFASPSYHKWQNWSSPRECYASRMHCMGLHYNLALVRYTAAPTQLHQAMDVTHCPMEALTTGTGRKTRTAWKLMTVVLRRLGLRHQPVRAPWDPIGHTRFLPWP